MIVEQLQHSEKENVPNVGINFLQDVVNFGIIFIRSDRSEVKTLFIIQYSVRITLLIIPLSVNHGSYDRKLCCNVRNIGILQYRNYKLYEIRVPGCFLYQSLPIKNYLRQRHLKPNHVTSLRLVNYLQFEYTQ